MTTAKYHYWRSLLHGIRTVLIVVFIPSELQNGYWKRWQLLKGSAEGGVEFEETWWEASDWTGFKEMGAEKRGGGARGGDRAGGGGAGGPCICNLACTPAWTTFKVEVGAGKRVVQPGSVG